jgi:hypothetical protein
MRQKIAGSDGTKEEKDNAETQRALRLAERKGKRFNTEGTEERAQRSQRRQAGC